MTEEELYTRVVEAGSFKRAAERVGVEPSSVSRKIAALEARLGVKLLHRSTRHTRPTELGQRYYEGLHNLLAEQAALEEEISTDASSITGTLRISAPVDFGAEFIVASVRELQQSAPDLSVELLLGSTFVNLVEEGIDVAVRIGDLPDSRLVASKIGDVPRVLVAGAGYLALHGSPTSIDELANHQFVLYTPAQGRSDIVFADGNVFPHTKVKSRITVNSVNAIRELVRDNVGIHWGPQWMFRSLLESGDIVQILPEHGLKSFPVHALVQSRSYTPRKVRAFVDLLKRRVVKDLASRQAEPESARSAQGSG